MGVQDRMLIAADAEAKACFQSAIDELKALPPVGLKGLLERARSAQAAIDAHTAIAINDYAPGHWPEEVCERQDELDEALTEACLAIREYLLRRDGLTTAEARELGGFLS